MDDKVIQSHLTWFGTLYECNAKVYFVLGPYCCPMSLLPGQYHLFRSDGHKVGVSIGRVGQESNVV
jgi:hypothetical protein